MNDDPQGTPQDGAEGAGAQQGEGDRIKNLQAEFSRKFENTNQTLAAILSRLESQTPTPQASPQGERKRVSVLEDEEAFARSIAEETEARIEKKLSDQSARAVKVQATVQSLYNEYPELNQQDSALMKRATEIYKAMGDEERTSHLAMKAAVLDAASELGVKPKSKRTTSQDDDFVLSSSSSSSNTQRKQKKEDIAEATLLSAQLMGINTSDPKVVEKLKKFSQRSTWGRFS